jgi:hypothetical protein
MRSPVVVVGHFAFKFARDARGRASNLPVEGGPVIPRRLAHEAGTGISSMLAIGV